MKSALTGGLQGGAWQRIPNFRIILEAPARRAARGKTQVLQQHVTLLSQGGFTGCVPCHHLPALTEDPRVANAAPAPRLGHPRDVKHRKHVFSGPNVTGTKEQPVGMFGSKFSQE